MGTLFSPVRSVNFTAYPVFYRRFFGNLQGMEGLVPWSGNHMHISDMS